jgi:hypothetical protein
MSYSVRITGIDKVIAMAGKANQIQGAVGQYLQEKGDIVTTGIETPCR